MLNRIYRITKQLPWSVSCSNRSAVEAENFVGCERLIKHDLTAATTTQATMIKPRGRMTVTKRWIAPCDRALDWDPYSSSQIRRSARLGSS